MGMILFFMLIGDCNSSTDKTTEPSILLSPAYTRVLIDKETAGQACREQSLDSPISQDIGAQKPGDIRVVRNLNGTAAIGRVVSGKKVGYWVTCGVSGNVSSVSLFSDHGGLPGMELRLGATPLPITGVSTYSLDGELGGGLAILMESEIALDESDSIFRIWIRFPADWRGFHEAGLHNLSGAGVSAMAECFCSVNQRISRLVSGSAFVSADQTIRLIGTLDVKGLAGESKEVHFVGDAYVDRHGRESWIGIPTLMLSSDAAKEVYRTQLVP